MAGSASAVSAPPWLGAIPTIATPAATATAAGTVRRNTSRAASKPTTATSGISTVGRCRTTSVGSAPETFATSARNPCQSGNAYPGWRLASGNSPTRQSERSPSSSSLRARARWKSPSPPTSPAIGHRSRPSRAPAAATAPTPWTGGGQGRRSARGAAATAATTSRSSVSVSPPETRNVSESAANTTTSAHTIVAETPRTPIARATSQPGASTTAVPNTSCRSRPTEPIRLTVPAVGDAARGEISLVGRPAPTAARFALGRSTWLQRTVRRGQGSLRDPRPPSRCTSSTFMGGVRWSPTARLHRRRGLGSRRKPPRPRRATTGSPWGLGSRSEP